MNQNQNQRFIGMNRSVPDTSTIYTCNLGTCPPVQACQVWHLRYGGVTTNTCQAVWPTTTYIY